MEKIKQQAKTAQLKMTGFSGWVKRHLVFTIITIIVILLFIGSLIFTATFYRDKSAPGVTIASTKIGGQTKAQIIEALTKLQKNMQLSLTYGGKSATASADDLGINIDINKLADEAVKTGQNNPFAIIFNRQHFDLTGSYDKSKVDHFVTTNFPELTTEPIDAQVIYNRETNQYNLKTGAVGKTVVKQRLYQVVENMLKRPGLSNYEIAISDSNPTISNDAAQKVVDHLNNVLSKPRLIINNDRILWTIDPWTIADWINLTANSQTGTYDISYNKEAIKNFVNSSVIGQLSNRPINQQAITNANGAILQVTKPGRNGQVANNTTEVIDGIYDSLVNNYETRVILTTRDAGYGTDATVTSDGRWIEANLSTYEVKLYDGTNLVWQTNRTSNGKPSTPTITGLFRVWRKTYNQCMPNPPSPEPLCNIHYVTYFEESGYAFHEAWWMTSDKMNTGLSHGCINMIKSDAQRVYEWATIGTPVWVHW